MASSEDFVQHVCELFAPLGHATARKMFGGHGVYLDGLCIAIIADDELYLKTDDATRPAFEREGCTPFVYVRDGKAMTLSYWRAPGEAMDAPHLMQPWGRLALQAALRAQAAKATKAAPKRKTAAKKKSSQPSAKKRVR